LGAARTAERFISAAARPTLSKTNVVNTIVVQDSAEIFIQHAKNHERHLEISGTPVTPAAPASASLLIKTGGSSTPYAFAINPNFTNAYVADDTLTGKAGCSAGITTAVPDHELRLRRHHQHWRARVAVNFSGVHPVIYATTAEASTNRLVSITDTGAASTVTTLATAGFDQVFRGVALTPDNGTVPQFSVRPGMGTTSRLAWTSLVNRNYTLQYTGDLGNPNWITLTNLTAALPVLTVTDTTAPVNTNRFYRLKLNP